jgi:tripartite-type tricarboxylate transporter receptor subunit TctC
VSDLWSDELPRRQFLRLAAGAAASPAVSTIAKAQTYPARPVRLIVGYPAGGAVDLIARLMGQWLSERLGQQFIIDNRPGSGGNLGTELVVQAPADGYTLLQVSLSNAINATLYENLHFNFIRDIEPIASILHVPGVMVVNPSFPVRTVPEFIDYAKANPGKINMGSAGNGSAPHVYGELFKMMAGVDLLKVSYRGGALALAGLLGGQVQITFDTLPTAIEHIKSSRLRPLAVTTSTRLKILPDVPTVGDFVPGYEGSGFQGIGAPKNTPVGIIDKLNKEINAALADPRMKARIADLGGNVVAGSPADFGRLIAEETEKWGKVIKFAGIKPE